jgi:hypothetical protein
VRRGVRKERPENAWNGGMVLSHCIDTHLNVLKYIWSRFKYLKETSFIYTFILSG